MKTRSLDHLKQLSQKRLVELEEGIATFRRAWQRGERPAISVYLPGDAELRLPLLIELVHIDMEQRIKAGEAVRLEQYEEQFPELKAALAAEGDTGAVHDQSATTVIVEVTADYVPEQLGTTIGPYKLLEQIGVGGFGLVYVAEQQKPVRRKVAIKIIKPGMDSRDVIARFEAERQALAMMDHPNIARVLDAGATDSGHPYFVMELVRGISITEFCDKNKLTPRERLELFVSVCQAVQHAHQKGIIHRDIKPSNVLVTLQDGKPLVKVIDFGVAKALHQPLTDKTIYTRFMQMIGTPLYMSPEQAEMSGLDIDTRSDIYSLGVLLYELLTGSTPFDKKRVASAGYDELIRMIRLEEPPKPSTRLSQSTESLPAIAAQRKTEPARLSKMFRGDLDWITMKALEKDRTRRYESASGLAADNLRFLNDEPVEAGPPSAAYRLRKLARRYRTALATSAAFVGLLIAAVVITTWMAFRANRETRRAEEQAELAELARREAEDNAQEAHRRHKQVLKFQGRAWTAVKDFSTDISENSLLDTPKLQRLRMDLLVKAIEEYNRILAESDSTNVSENRKVRAELAAAQLRLAQVSADLERVYVAAGAASAAIGIAETLLRDEVTTDELGSLGVGTFKGRVRRAGQGPLPVDKLVLLPALVIAKRGVDTWQKLVDKHRPSWGLRYDLAGWYDAKGIFEMHLSLSNDALRSFHQAIDIWSGMTKERPADVNLFIDLASPYANIAKIYELRKETAKAIEWMEQCRNIEEPLLQSDTSGDVVRANMIGAFKQLAELYTAQGNAAKARKYYEQALRMHDELSKSYMSLHKKELDQITAAVQALSMKTR